jgi:hypothetical protein
MRVEVFPHDPACSAGAAPRIKVWVLPKDICQNGAVSAICNSAKNLSLAFNPSLPLPTGAVVIESCIPSPPTSMQFDELYFGMTASSLTGASGPLLNIRNLGAAAYLSP